MDKKPAIILISVLLILVTVIRAQAALKDEFTDYTTAGNLCAGDGNTHNRGTQFIPTSTYNITSFAMLFNSSSGSTTANLTGYLLDDSNTLLATATNKLVGSTLTGTPTWFIFTGINQELVGSTTYRLAVSCEGQDADADVIWVFTNESASLSQFYGGSFPPSNSVSGYRLDFKAYDSTVVSNASIYFNFTETWDATDSQPGECQGIKLNATSNINLNEVSQGAGGSATGAYLYAANDSNGNVCNDADNTNCMDNCELLASSNFSSDLAPFDYNLSAGKTYYIVGWSGGAGFSRTYKAVTFPINNSEVNVLKGFNAADDGTYLIQIHGIRYTLGANVTPPIPPVPFNASNINDCFNSTGAENVEYIVQSDFVSSITGATYCIDIHAANNITIELNNHLINMSTSLGMYLGGNITMQNGGVDVSDGTIQAIGGDTTITNTIINGNNIVSVIQNDFGGEPSSSLSIFDSTIIGTPTASAVVWLYNVTFANISGNTIIGRLPIILTLFSRTFYSSNNVYNSTNAGIPRSFTVQNNEVYSYNDTMINGGAVVDTSRPVTVLYAAYPIILDSMKTVGYDHLLRIDQPIAGLNVTILNPSGDYQRLFQISENSSVIYDNLIITDVDVPGLMYVDFVKRNSTAYSYFFNLSSTGTVMVQDKWFGDDTIDEYRGTAFIQTLTTAATYFQFTSTTSVPRLYRMVSSPPNITLINPLTTVTTSAYTLAVATNKNVSCKYGTNYAPYDNLTSVFDSTGGTLHTQALGAANGIYTFTVACKSLFGGIGSDNFTVDINIAATPPSHNNNPTTTTTTTTGTTPSLSGISDLWNKKITPFFSNLNQVTGFTVANAVGVSNPNVAQAIGAFIVFCVIVGLGYLGYLGYAYLSS